MFSRWRPSWCSVAFCVCSRIYEVTIGLQWLRFDVLANIRDRREMERWIVSSFPIPVSRVMACLFKTVVNIGLLLPIYFVPVDFYRMMCGLIVLKQRSFSLVNFIICLKFLLCLCASVRVQPCGLAFWAGQERALMRRICNWSPLPGEWCHYDRDGQLRPDRRQDLRCWSIPDGERQLLPPRCLQDYITKVKLWGEEGSYFTNITRSRGGKVWTSFFFFFFPFCA